MKRSIVVVRGEVKEIARLMGCTPDMVGHSLAFRKNTPLAQRIRRMAMLRGGIEVGNEPVNTVEDGRAVGMVQQ